MKVFFLVSLISLINSFYISNNKKNYNLNIFLKKEKPIDNDKLKILDDKFNKLNLELKKIKKNKLKLLTNIPGLKLLNESQIDDYYNNLKITDKSKPEFDSEYEPDFDSDFDSDDLSELNINKKGIQIIYQKQSFKNVPENIPPKTESKTDNFEIIKKSDFKFKDVGGYNLIKEELMQCADLLTNHKKYSKYNVRTPKGLILEGPPGNGKTLLAKAFCGEIDINFIPVSGAQFQEKYIGVGASRVRELFELAKENIPCVIFIDEIDAIGRRRSSDSESHNSEKDSTLNELLVNIDGFKSSDGIFIIGATNRVDLLDSALIRPGRIDKKIFINNPDRITREAIINIHIKGKPYDKNIKIQDLVEITNGFSGAQIENFLNEAMLHTLRNNKKSINLNDLKVIANKILVGWQSTENLLSNEMIYQVAIHEMGHALVGFYTNYKKLIKVTINLWSPTTLGFTLFETNESDNKILTKEKLISELMILLGGYIAEEIFFEKNTSSSASHDLEQATNLARNMIIKLGMGNKLIIPSTSEKYKQIIDKEIDDLIEEAYQKARIIIINYKNLLKECADALVVKSELSFEYIQKKCMENK